MNLSTVVVLSMHLYHTPRYKPTWGMTFLNLPTQPFCVSRYASTLCRHVTVWLYLLFYRTSEGHYRRQLRLLYESLDRYKTNLFCSTLLWVTPNASANSVAFTWRASLCIWRIVLCLVADQASQHPSWRYCWRQSQTDSRPHLDHHPAFPGLSTFPYLH